MDAKELRFDDDARAKLLEGALIIYKAVGCTLGPKGKIVLLERGGESPRATKDGVTVARNIVLKDPFQNMGASMIREAAKQASDEAGDGTTTATILAVELLQAGMKQLSTGANVESIKKGLEIGLLEVLKFFEEQGKPVSGVEQVAQVGTCAANQDAKIGSLIAEAMDKAGKDGMVNVEEDSRIDTVLELVPGAMLDAGYMDPRFSTTPAMKAQYEDRVAIVLIDRKLSIGKNLVPLLEWVNRVKPQIPLLIIAQEITGAALGTLVGNRIKVGLPIVAVKAPSWGGQQKELFQDLQAMFGGQVMSVETGIDIQNIKTASEKEIKDSEKYFGWCEKVIVDRNSTLICGPMGDKKKKEERMEQLRGLLEGGKLTSYDAEKVTTRLARMAGGISKISVGAETDVARKELKDRVEDALHACKAAVEEGVMPGGGVMCFYARDRLKKLLESPEYSPDVKNGITILWNALEAPINMLASNAGEKEGSITSKLLAYQEEVDELPPYEGLSAEPEILEKLKTQLKTRYNYGWNASTNKFGDLVKMGVVVPRKVERVALMKAVSVASLLISTAACIVDEPIQEELGSRLPVM